MAKLAASDDPLLPLPCVDCDTSGVSLCKTNVYGATTDRVRYRVSEINTTSLVYVVWGVTGGKTRDH